MTDHGPHPHGRRHLRSRREAEPTLSHRAELSHSALRVVDAVLACILEAYGIRSRCIQVEINQYSTLRCGPGAGIRASGASFSGVWMATPTSAWMRSRASLSHCGVPARLRSTQYPVLDQYFRMMTTVRVACLPTSQGCCIIRIPGRHRFARSRLRCHKRICDALLQAEVAGTSPSDSACTVAGAGALLIVLMCTSDSAYSLLTSTFVQFPPYLHPSPSLPFGPFAEVSDQITISLF